MTVLLILTILILTGIALWQITKIFELSQLGQKKDNSQIATEKDNDLNGKLMFAFLVFIYAVTIYSFWTYSKVLLPESASAHGPAYDTLLWISFAVILFAQTITQAVLHIFAYQYRGINNRKAYFFTHDNKLEFIWTIIPAIIFFMLIIYGMITWGKIMNFEEDDDALVVELYAQQWNWKARYGGEDNVLGDANVRFLNDFDGKKFSWN
jgi:cytochrome c oxidase subunit 2